MKFEMICTGGPFGDSCCNYDVRIEGNCTVREFIESVLKEKPGEWGTFEIVKDMKYTLQSMTDDCEYKKGEITRNFKRKETEEKEIHISLRLPYRLDMISPRAAARGLSAVMPLTDVPPGNPEHSG